ncbi:pantetheine-phosphate adenylyltransferase [Oceanibacterium hippocampi]|uniref:Phosphopantetheine adenylyltransferase n=1 Tax=Oceanibacterium hippocampi TaxID=745714 RepID=A0A1Y5TA84_9PROT|nr:pantetheine-phosphate adenylyltransferase [Oceanibacterium hippocampi]SLN55809.1 Phosphopantetheine adenylyltransferase [Oceanibacterium hippocampi]
MRGDRLVGLYPGTFDPITLGHYDVIKRAAKLVDRLVIGVARNPGKNPMFTVDERVEMVRESTRDISEFDIDVMPFDSLLMHFAMSIGASIIVRGLRAFSDFEYEFQMVGMNSRLNEDIETVFLMASDNHQFISSTLVKEIVMLEGDISKFVSASVADRLLKRAVERRAAKAG